jgi:hypothetical protein
MALERRKQVVLAALLVVLAIAAFRAYRTALAPPFTTVPAQSASSRAAPRQGGPAPQKGGVPDVQLEALEAERPAPGDSSRNVFEFQAALPEPLVSPAPPPVAPPASSGSPTASPASPMAPIALKFIGIIEAPDRGGKIAVLSDSRGVYHGREGEIVEGRYRILKIGTESIEIAHVDGRGRQTIRLTG